MLVLAGPVLVSKCQIRRMSIDDLKLKSYVAAKYQTIGTFLPCDNILKSK